MMGKLGYLLKIVGHAAHEHAALVFIEKAYGQLFKMVEHLPAHIRLYPHAYDMPPVIHYELHAGLEQVYAQQHAAPQHQPPHIPLRHIDVYYILGYYGIKHIARRYYQRAKHVYIEQPSMGLVVGRKPFEHDLSLSISKEGATPLCLPDE